MWRPVSGVVPISTSAARQFSATAAAEGIGSTLSIPLVVAGDGVGALNIYCRRLNGFSAGDESMAMALGSAAAVTLTNARTYWKTARLAGQLQQALDSHGTVERATGILMAQHRCPADQALHLLAATAQRNHLTVDEVAADLTQRTSSS